MTDTQLQAPGIHQGGDIVIAESLSSQTADLKSRHSLRVRLSK
jgi:hypothetical protein